MKKKLLLFTMLFALLIAASSCGSSNSNDNSAANNSSSQSQMQDGQNQRRMNRADLRGQVVSVKADKITIKVIKTPEFGRGNGKNFNNNNNNNGNKSNRPNRNGGNRQHNQNGGNRNFQRKLEFTSKTQTLTIAKDAEITLRKFGQNGMETQDITAKDIKNNSIVQIWLSKDDKNTIERISLMDTNN